MVDTVLTALGKCPYGAPMADLWRESGTLRVRRNQPYITGADKLLPLHILGTTSLN